MLFVVCCFCVVIVIVIVIVVAFLVLVFCVLFCCCVLFSSYSFLYLHGSSDRFLSALRVFSLTLCLLSSICFICIDDWCRCSFVVAAVVCVVVVVSVVCYCTVVVHRISFSACVGAVAVSFCI